MSYNYKGKTPLGYAQEFIDAYIKKTPASNLPPKGWFTYHQGVFLSGVEKVYEQSGNSFYASYINQWLESILDENKKPIRMEGHFWNSPDSLDFRQPANLIFRLYKKTGDERYMDALSELIESLKDYPVNNSGGFWHMKSQPNQMWLDGLYMAGPICARYAMCTGKMEYADMAVKQAVIMYENMVDKNDGLLFHGWDDSFTAQWADKETGLSSEKWGRALGWFSVASADIIEILGRNYKGIAQLCANLASVLKALCTVQRESGFWCQVIDKPEKEDNWDESSCTCLIAYAMAKAVRLGILGEEYLAPARKAFEAVIDSLQTDIDGTLVLGGICVGTCIDEGTYEHYINRDTCANDLHGSGAFILMCAEMNLI